MLCDSLKQFHACLKTIYGVLVTVLSADFVALMAQHLQLQGLAADLRISRYCIALSDMHPLSEGCLLFTIIIMV